MNAYFLRKARSRLIRSLPFVLALSVLELVYGFNNSFAPVAIACLILLGCCLLFGLIDYLCGRYFPKMPLLLPLGFFNGAFLLAGSILAIVSSSPMEGGWSGGVTFIGTLGILFGLANLLSAAISLRLSRMGGSLEEALKNQMGDFTGPEPTGSLENSDSEVVEAEVVDVEDSDSHPEE